ncbi:phosphatase PAP2 family protein [Stenotrophomonas sp. S41]|uniref:phosphatase PAP2 family protein n=1 Tax=Stenotrophomonas sp. S41 TaxID=2767464 RepID=UPI0019098684|nr:phosphatase PAP2 family protein [Stenotrophomonas sp. S41]MBK0012126.1 phosphatase PAP2 family protein [Stenotrophomonas sp. S41]
MPDVWKLLSSLGDSRWLLPMIAILLISLPRSSFKWRALAAIALTAALTLASKLAYMGWGLGIADIDFTGFSGHAAMSSAIYPVAGTLLAGTPRPARIAGFSAGTILALLIGWSRIPLHAHSVSEVVAGLVLGLSAAAWSLRSKPLPARPHAWILAVSLAAGLTLPIAPPHLRTHQIVVELAKWLSGRPVVMQRHSS